jgi:aspartate 1-decarboxylase
MTKTILLSGLLFSFLMSNAQRQLPQTWIRKMPAVNDSLYVNKERQKSLSTYHTAANKERKNILVFSAATRNTKDHDALFIGRLEKKEVYKVNSSAIVSKNIAETEKNLDLIFADAARSQAILFFDGADELFSKTKQPEAIANYIQTLAQAKNVMTIFWCEEDCLPWLGKSKYVLVQ